MLIKKLICLKLFVCSIFSEITFQIFNLLMKKTIFVFIFTALTLFALAQKNNVVFDSYRIAGVGQISIPSCMEEQTGMYKKMSKVFERQVEAAMGVDIPGEKVVFQQKGLNDLNQAGFATYARVIIETETAASGSFYRLHSRYSVSPAELAEINNEMKNQIEQIFYGTNIRIISWYGVSFVNVNGVKAMKVSYLRQLENQPYVLVNSYKFQNYDRMHTLTLSYRKQDEKIWKPLYAKIVNSISIRPVF